MKKLALLPLFLMFLFTACQEKESEAEPSAAQMIQGKWTRSSSSLKYYDASNNLLYDDSFEEEVFFDFSSNRFSISHPGSEDDIFTASYSIQQSPDGNIIRLVADDGLTTEYTITMLTETNMVWEEESENKTYNDGTGEKVAARLVGSYNFEARTE